MKNDFIAKRTSADSFALYCGKPCPANLFGRVFEAYDKQTGDHRDGWALRFNWPELASPDDHFPTLQAALAYARWMAEGYFEYTAAEARAEHEAENAWLRYAEMGTLESQHEEDLERQREAAWG